MAVLLSARRLPLKSESHDTKPLSCLRRGDCGVICESCLNETDDAFVRALGVRLNRAVRVCRGSGSCVIEVADGAGETTVVSSFIRR